MASQSQNQSAEKAYNQQKRIQLGIDPFEIFNRNTSQTVERIKENQMPKHFVKQNSSLTHSDNKDRRMAKIGKIVLQ